MVFEALHNLEPRGYVVGWIIAISLLVGILIFLLLAVLLWKVSVGSTMLSDFPHGTPGLRPHRGCGALGDVRSIGANEQAAPSGGRWNLASSWTTLERAKHPQSPLFYPKRIN